MENISLVIQVENSDQSLNHADSGQPSMII